MHIVAHRGITSPTEKKDGNTIELLLSSLNKGFGVETDLRDFLGNIVLSHDPPTKQTALLEEFLCRINTLNKKQVLALNIKSDGQHNVIRSILQKYESNKTKILENAFFFDMSIPSLYQFSKIFPKRNLASRISDLECIPLLYDRIGWLWVDCFEKEWFDEEQIEKFMADGKNLCFVSPELHNLPHLELWKKLKQSGHNGLYLCTDLAAEAKSFFGVQ